MRSIQIGWTRAPTRRSTRPSGLVPVVLRSQATRRRPRTRAIPTPAPAWSA